MPFKEPVTQFGQTPSAVRPTFRSLWPAMTPSPAKAWSGCARPGRTPGWRCTNIMQLGTDRFLVGLGSFKTLGSKNYVFLVGFSTFVFLGQLGLFKDLILCSTFFIGKHFGNYEVMCSMVPICPALSFRGWEVSS